MATANGNYDAVKLEAHFWPDKNDSAGLAYLLYEEDKTDNQRVKNSYAPPQTVPPLQRLDSRSTRAVD